MRRFIQTYMERMLVRHNTRDKVDRDLAATIAGLAVVTFLALVIVCAGSTGARATAVLWAVACLMGGYMLGFLFGIPRVLQSDVAVGSDPAKAADARAAAGGSGASTANARRGDYRQQVNTNLEQISDWLTKIIVGIGLIQLRNLPEYLNRSSQFVASGLNSPAQNQSFALALIICFSVLGFLGGYLLTRMFFAGAFSRADRHAISLALDVEQRQALRAVRLDPEGQRSAISPDAADAARRVEHVPLEELTRVEDVVLWAKAQINADDPHEAVRGFQRALSLAPGDPRLAYELALAMSYAGRAPAEVVRQLERARASGSRVSDAHFRHLLYTSLTYNSLYLSRPESYEKAIRYGEEYLENKDNEVSKKILTNLACAYGQKADELRRDHAEFANVRAKALDAARKVVEFDGPDGPLTAVLRRALHPDFPDKPAEENDLEVFGDDPEFLTLLPR